MKHDQRVDVNRDIVGLSGANFAAGLTGHLRGQRQPHQDRDPRRAEGPHPGRQHHHVAAVALLFVLFLTGLLTNMPKAVLAGIVFLIGLGLVDVDGLQRIRRARESEFLIACVTGVVVFGVGVEQGIILAIVVSIIELVRRAYSAEDFVIGQSAERGPRLRTGHVRGPEPAPAC